MPWNPPVNLEAVISGNAPIAPICCAQVGRQGSVQRGGEGSPFSGEVGCTSLSRRRGFEQEPLLGWGLDPHRSSRRKCRLGPDLNDRQETGNQTGFWRESIPVHRSGGHSGGTLSCDHRLILRGQGVRPYFPAWVEERPRCSLEPASRPAVSSRG